MEMIKSFVDVAPQLTQPLVLMGFVFLLIFGIHKTLIKSGLLPVMRPTTGGIIVLRLLKYSFWLAVLVIVLGYGLKAYDIFQNTQPINNVNNSIEDKYDSTRITANTKPDIDLESQTAHETWVKTPPVLDYRFDKDNNDFIVHNHSVYSTTTDDTGLGKGNRGKGTSIVAGKKGKSLQFDGSINAYVKVPIYPIALQEVDTNLSIEATVWFDSDASLHNGPIVCDRNRYNNSGGFLLRVWRKRLTFHIASATNPKDTVVAKSVWSMLPDTWYHVVATFDNGTAKVYINGDLSGKNDAAFSRTSLQSYEPLYLGASQINTAHLQGRIDEVRIFNRTLSSSEVSNLYDKIFR
jgi:hypothetical protein